MSGIAAALAEIAPEVTPEDAPAPGLVFEDLGAILDGTLVPPDMLVDDLLYVEGVHILGGHPGSGKTTLTMNAAWTAMGEGRHVVWLDYEGGTRPTVRRLRDVGVPDDLILERFHYAGWPVDAPAHLGTIAERWPGAMVVFDSASKAITLSNLDENSPSDVTRWAAPIVKASKLYSLPVVIIDHVTKNATASSRYSRGAGSKLADVDVQWYVEATEPFNREQSGLIHCRQQKDREGCMPFDLWYTIGDGRGGLATVPSCGPEPERSDPPTAAGPEPTI